MQAILALVALLLLAVAVFAFQNSDPVTVRFLHWQASASLAVVALAATASGALAATLVTIATRLVRWTRGGPTDRGAAAVPPPPVPPAAPGVRPS